MEGDKGRGKWGEKERENLEEREERREGGR